MVLSKESPHLPFGATSDPAIKGIAESLAKFGFIPDEELSSANNFARQLESYALHVIEDKPVSNAHLYFIENSQIFIDKEKKNKLAVDPEERGGLSFYGTHKAIEEALKVPGKVIFFYSPPGPVAFESGTKYDLVKPYTDGQLYLMVGNVNNQVDAIAVSIGKENEEKALDIFLGKDRYHGGFDDEVEKIKYYLTNPQESRWDVDDYLTYLEAQSYLLDFPVYKNVHNETFSLSDVLKYLKDGWLKQIEPTLKLDYDYLYKIAQIHGSEAAFKTELKIFMPLLAENGVLKLGGGCGGTGITKNDLLPDPLEEMKQTNPLSTDYRLSSSASNILNKKSSDDSDEVCVTCPYCGNKEHNKKTNSGYICGNGSCSSNRKN